MITQAELKNRLHYEPETGVFTWIARAQKVTVGTQAGTNTNDGYISICVGRKMYRSHRLAWLYMTGELPLLEIDHINGVKDDNKWCNLRMATRAENAWNTKVRKHSQIGVKGVEKAGKNFQARINANGKRYGLGVYKTIEEAAAVYQEAAKRLHGEFARMDSNLDVENVAIKASDWYERVKKEDEEKKETQRRADLYPELLEALKLAVRQNQCDMLMTGEELRKCEAAIAKAEGKA